MYSLVCGLMPSSTGSATGLRQARRGRHVAAAASTSAPSHRACSPPSLCACACAQVRTQTLVKSAIIQVDAAPFKQWYQQHYGLEVGGDEGGARAAGGGWQHTPALRSRSGRASPAALRRRLVHTRAGILSCPSVGPLLTSPLPAAASLPCCAAGGPEAQWWRRRRRCRRR